MLVFVDTSAWIAVAVKKDKNHQIAADYYKDLLKIPARLVTSNYVLAETYTRLRYDVSHQKILEFYGIILEACKENRLAVIWIDERLERDSWEIFKKYSDQMFSFVDCTSFAICKKIKVDQVFAFDDDFKIMGFLVKP